ncbi:hypothetical protein NIES4074_14000 [Cylindrospermum sp. NIES-4074]|nr:hypothetical protein NIES4074_14000 [Cylindrospermum sp. NIES-4074]
MSQNPLSDSAGSTQSSKAPGLKPALAVALASLEVQLDQELTRYRRARAGMRTQKQARGGYIDSQPQQLTGTKATAGRIQALVADNKITATPPEKSVPALAKSEEVSYVQEPTKTPTPPPLPKSASSIVPAVVKTPESENRRSPDDAPSQPDDYLESSEALLRSLTAEQQEIKKTSNTNDSLLSPLGIGSMLLLLVASLTLGYVVFNPKGLPQLNLAKLSNASSSPSGENTETAANNPQPPAEQESALLPKYPNLAAKEFPEVRDPNDVVGLKPKIQPTPTAVTTPLAVAPPLNPVVPLNPTPIATPEPLAQPTITPPQVNAEIKLPADGFYHIVTDNQGDGALAAARQVVPDAYLSQNKKFIYLGALKTQEEVQQRLQQLQTKGIKARLQQP